MFDQLLARFAPDDPRMIQLYQLTDEIDKTHQPSFRIKLNAMPLGRSILESSQEERCQWILAMAVWIIRHGSTPHRPDLWTRYCWPMSCFIMELIRPKLPFDTAALLELLDWSIQWRHDNIVKALVRSFENHVQTNPLEPEEKARVQKLIEHLEKIPLRESQQQAFKLRELIGAAGPTKSPLQAGDLWAEAALGDLEKLPEPQHAAWIKLLNYCMTATGSAPTLKWRKGLAPLLNQIGFENLEPLLSRWFHLVPKRPAGETVMHCNETNLDMLRILAWLGAEQESPALARALTVVAATFYGWTARLGPRALSVGNAAVWALGHMPGSEGVVQLSILKARAKGNTAQKQIQSALAAAAERMQLSPDEIEELTVPSCGLQEVGLRRELLGEFTAELTVAGADLSLTWIGPDGKPRASVPAAVKRDHAGTQKELAQSLKDLRALLPAQRDRLDRLFLAQKKWDLAVWRQRYLDHPLVGTLARRLIWKFSRGDRAASGIWWQGQIVGLDDHPLDWLSDDAQVEIWHPIQSTAENVRAWRDWLTRHEIRQPFKQAHREIYLLTDAERRTEIYSNRFAAHILKQHQFNALCGIRGWKNKLHIMADEMYPPAMRHLPQWGLRAEFWVMGIGENPATDATDAGAYLYLSTDQVRFYATDAPENWAHSGDGAYAAKTIGALDPPLPLEQIPPLVLSEILRDVDLFVGVTSVGNDPTWTDTGRTPQQRDYWTHYSFGELSETAAMRAQVLEPLLPCLKIGPRCRLSGRFLIVQGDLRTYKIHLGSGNILMEPHDQYLCIVPGRSSSQWENKIFLPFEGDPMLSIILSKAFLLADDKKITDPTIVNQIKQPGLSPR